MFAVKWILNAPASEIFTKFGMSMIAMLPQQGHQSFAAILDLACFETRGLT